MILLCFRCFVNSKLEEKHVEKTSENNKPSKYNLGKSVFVSFHQRFHMAVRKFVILSNVSSQLNFAGKGTKESHFKQALGPITLNFQKNISH